MIFCEYEWKRARNKSAEIGTILFTRMDSDEYDSCDSGPPDEGKCSPDSTLLRDGDKCPPDSSTPHDEVESPPAAESGDSDVPPSETTSSPNPPDPSSETERETSDAKHETGDHRLEPSDHKADTGDTNTDTTESTDIPETDHTKATESSPEKPSVPSEAGAGGNQKGGGGGGGGWGGWGGWGGSLWSSVSTVAESAQAIGQKMTAVIASVEDSLGVPSPEEIAQQDTQVDQETCRLAEEMKEHDVSPEPSGDVVTAEPRPDDEDTVAPEAVEMARDPDSVQSQEEQDLNLGAVSGFLSGFAAAVQSTSQELVSGGLGALETLGKKTMEVLSDGDPGLAKKRAILGMGSSPTLSQLLKEAKAAEVVVRSEEGGGEVDTSPAPLNYSKLFDEYHGVSHLEALELLSKECAGKVHSMSAGFSGDELKSLQENLKKLSEAFEIDEEEENLEDDSSQLEEVTELFSDVTLPFRVDKLLKVSAGWREKVEHVSTRGGGDVGKERSEEEKEGTEGKEGSEVEKEGTKKEGSEEGKEGSEEEKEGTKKEGSEEGSEGSDMGTEGTTEVSSDKKAVSEELYENGLCSLAEMTSAAIELFRKMAEISLLPDFSHNKPLLQAQKFNRLTMLVSNELDALASVHSEAITELDLEGTNATVTSLYLESSNSGSYVQDAFQLLLPVLKCSLIQQLKSQQPEPGPNVLNRN